MFGRGQVLPIDPARAARVYAKLSWLKGHYGAEGDRDRPTCHPGRDLPGPRFDGSEEGLARLAGRVGETMGIPGGLETEFTNREGAVARLEESRRRGEGAWTEQGVAGLYYRADTGEEGGAAVLVDLGRFADSKPETLVAVLAHEYAHHRLRGAGEPARGDEELADLLPVLLGFGVHQANAAFQYRTDGYVEGPLAWHSWTLSRLGYLSVGELAFAHALVSAWKGEGARRAARGMSGTAKDLFRKCRRWLERRELRPWPETGDDGLAASLAREAEREASGPSMEVERPRFELVWRGSFVTASVPAKEGGCLLPTGGVLDFLERRRALRLAPGQAFGIAYRLIGEGGAGYRVVESVYPPGPPAEAGAETAVARREWSVGDRELAYLVCKPGTAPYDRSGTWVFEVTLGEESLAREAIEVAMDPGG